MAAEPDSQKTVIVLGMHRSGTSMVAGVLKELGVSMGTKLMRRTEWNPLGYFEDLEFVRLNNQILDCAGGSYLNPPDAAAILAQRNIFRPKIAKLIGSKKSNLWGWKDPRTCLNMEIYLPFIDHPYFIICHRSPQEISNSLNRRDNMPTIEAMRLISIYNQRIELLFKDHPGLKRLDLDYNEALEHSGTTVNLIAKFIALDVNKETLDRATSMICSRHELNTIVIEIKHRDVLYNKYYKRIRTYISKLRRLLQIKS